MSSRTKQTRFLGKLCAVFHVLPALLFIFFIFRCLYLNSDFIFDQLHRTFFEAKSLEQITNILEKSLREEFADKFAYVNLNGGVAHWLGINNVNGVQRHANGNLAPLSMPTDVPSVLKNAQEVVDLSSFLKSKNIPFLFAMFPRKNTFYVTHFAPGYILKNLPAFQTQKKIFVETFDKTGINYVDMSAWFQENGWSAERTFFKTDHHWRAEAAFEAAKEITAKLEESCGYKFDHSLNNLDNWNVKTYKNWFLGYLGKKVGIYYGGVDDFNLIWPKEVHIEESFLPYCGTFNNYRSGVIDWDFLNDKDYFNINPYASFIGGDYPLARISNPDAAIKKRILVSGDSFRLPLEVFLSAHFSDVYHVDLRHYTDGTIAELISELKPDIVLVCHAEDVFSYREVFSYGTQQYMEALKRSNPEDAVRWIGDRNLTENCNSNHFTVLTDNLNPNQYYTLIADSVSIEKKDGPPGEYVQFTLQNLANNEPIFNRYFSTVEKEPQKWIFKTPDDTNGSYAIFMYAGTKDATAGISAKVVGIKLQEGIH